jgi:hypothetical protein
VVEVVVLAALLVLEGELLHADRSVINVINIAKKRARLTDFSFIVFPLLFHVNYSSLEHTR